MNKFYIISYNLENDYVGNDYGTKIFTNFDDAQNFFNTIKNKFIELKKIDIFDEIEVCEKQNEITCYVPCEDCYYKGQFYWIKFEEFKGEN